MRPGVVGLLALLFLANEAQAAGAKSRLLFRSRGHAAYQADVMRTMTLDKAFEVLQNRSVFKGWLSLAESQLGASRHLVAHSALRGAGSQLVAHKHRQRRHRRAFNELLTALNEQLADALLRKDAECAKCSAFEAQRLRLIDSLRQDVGDFSSRATSARAEILRAQFNGGKVTAKVPVLRETLHTQEQGCDDDFRATSSELQIAEGDVDAMARVLAASPCSPRAAALLACRGGAGGRRGRALLALRHRSITAAVAAAAELRAEAAKRALLTALLEVEEEKQSMQERTILTRAAGRRASRRWRRGGGAPGGKLAAKCGAKINPTCDNFRAKVLQFQSQTLDKRSRLQGGLAELQQRCMSARREYAAEITGLEQQGRAENHHLAFATHDQIQMQEQWRLKQKELARMSQEYEQEMQRCNVEVAGLQEEVCGYQRVRGELGKAEGGGQVFFQDCEVSDWTHGECSVSCGGHGTQVMTRDIIALPVQGARCPPLRVMQACGEEPCPVDCKMGDWSGWSSCTAECGGGVRERARRVLTHGSHTGQPCNEATQAEPCNAQACSLDCDLGRWSEWSPCSASCGNGTQHSERPVESPAVGTGTCPAADSSQRLRFQICGNEPCPLGADHGLQDTPECKARIDVVLLLDGSAFVGDVGWSLLRRAAEQLARALGSGGQDGPRLAALVFGGAAASARCMPWMSSAPAAGEVDIRTDCGIQWLRHLPDPIDGGALADRIAGLPYTAGNPLLAIALGLAEDELLQGREGVRSVVLVITAGRPVSPAATAQAAARLRRKARLIWVPVVRGDAEEWPPLKEMEAWASRPLHENLIAVEGYKTLAKPTVVSRLVEEVCEEAQ